MLLLPLLYPVAGAVVAVVFATAWAPHLVAGTPHLSLGARLILLPGALLLWPIILWRWIARPGAFGAVDTPAAKERP